MLGASEPRGVTENERESESDADPVAVPWQVHCEIRTLRQMNTHEMRSAEALDAMEAYNFDAALSWTLDNPDAYLRAVERGTTGRSEADDA